LISSARTTAFYISFHANTKICASPLEHVKISRTGDALILSNL
jgi:hypothetical protein